MSVAAVAVWSAVATAIIVMIVAWTVGLRVDRDAEIQGLDFTSHGETGYNINA